MVTEEGMIQSLLVKWMIRSEAPAVYRANRNMGNVHRLSGSGWSHKLCLRYSRAPWETLGMLNRSVGEPAEGSLPWREKVMDILVTPGVNPFTLFYPCLFVPFVVPSAGLEPAGGNFQNLLQ